jgi:hypothetical protein
VCVWWEGVGVGGGASKGEVGSRCVKHRWFLSKMESTCTKAHTFNTQGRVDAHPCPPDHTQHSRSTGM